MKIGKGEFEDVPKDVILEFVIERGAYELRNATDDF